MCELCHHLTLLHPNLSKACLHRPISWLCAVSADLPPAGQGNLTGAMAVLKGTPTTYNKDNQEIWELLFSTLDTMNDTIGISTGVLSTLTINKDKMLSGLSPDMLATDLAEYLVRKVPRPRSLYPFCWFCGKWCEWCSWPLSPRPHPRPVVEGSSRRQVHKLVSLFGGTPGKHAHQVRNVGPATYQGALAALGTEAALTVRSSALLHNSRFHPNDHWFVGDETQQIADWYPEVRSRE
jgi:hypothetical protein